MAIKIPSTRYYNREKVHKLRKDIIDKVEYSNHDLKYTVDYNTIVDSKEYEYSNSGWQETPTESVSNTQNYIDGSTSYLQMYHKTYVFPIDIIIKKIQDSGLKDIIYLINGEENGVKGLQFTLTYREVVGSFEFSYTQTDTFTPPPIKTKNVISSTILDTNIAPILTSHHFAQGNPYPMFSSYTISTENQQNADSIEFTLQGEEYKSKNGEKLKINIGVETKDVWAVEILDFETTYYEWQGGYYYEQIPLKLAISFYGHSGKYEQIDIPLVYGDGKSVYQMTTNELFQTDTKYSISTTNPTNPLSRGVVPDDSIIDITKNVAEMKAENIVNNHQNGKEQLELLLSINEYYDENGNLAISTKNNELPMTFEQNQIVLPLKPTNRGDIPLSENRDGTPKRFIVKGVEFIFDGAVWQKIYAEEYIS